MLAAALHCLLQKGSASKIGSTEYWQQLFAKQDTVDYPIVFVHGIGGGFATGTKPSPTFPAANTSVCVSITTVTCSTTIRAFHRQQATGSGTSPTTTITPVKEALQGTLNTYAERLRDIIEVAKNMSGSEKVILISHSMGGLVARAYMTLDDILLALCTQNRYCGDTT